MVSTEEQLEPKRQSIVLLNSCFVGARSDHIQDVNPHLRVGVASIAAYLRREGHDVSVFDSQVTCSSLGALIDKIVSLEPGAVALPAYTEEIHDSARVAAAIKEKAPNIMVIIGGYHVSALPEETLTMETSFDIGIIGLAEQPLDEVLRGDSLGKVQGIAYRNGDGEVVVNPPRKEVIPLDNLPMPAWDLYDLEKYDQLLPLEPLRACPFSCTFCYRTTGRETSYKSAQKFIEEVEYYHNHYGINEFLFVAGTFPLKRTHAMEICEGIIAAGLRITWSSSTRVNLLDEELLAVMKKSGCQALQLGIESGSEKVLNFSAKGVTPEESVTATRLCKQAGIKAGMNFILGLPLETKETLMETYRLASRLRPYADSANFAILVPFPGTAIYDYAKQGLYGLHVKTFDWSQYGKQGGQALRHENFAEGELQRYQAYFYLMYYLRRPLKMLALFSFRRAAQVLRGLLRR